MAMLNNQMVSLKKFKDATIKSLKEFKDTEIFVTVIVIIRTSQTLLRVINLQAKRAQWTPDDPYLGYRLHPKGRQNPPKK